MEPRSTVPVPHMPERLGRYRVVRPLSKGGMAHVFEARRESLAGVSPRVAIKLILPEFSQHDGFQELFINEARLGASMNHQNLVGIQEFDRDGENFFLVMEYVEGLTLRRIVSLCARHGIGIPLLVIAEIGRQACDGLHHAHSANDEQGRHLGLVHRDVKPSNLILNPQGVVKVLDFGISKGRLMHERRGAVKGTWGYMAPEQALGHDVGPSSDVFALAIVLWELAGLKPLFESREQDDIRRQLAEDHAARTATQLDPAYGPLIPVLVRALQRDGAGRYPTAAEMGRALSSLLPDPITARDEVVRFFLILDALDRGRPVPSGRPAAASSPGASQGSIAQTASQVVTPRAPSLVWVVLGALFVTVAAVLVVAAVVLLVNGLPAFTAAPAPPATVAAAVPPSPPAPRLAADEPAGPAGAGAPGEARPAPVAASEKGASRPPPAKSVSAKEPAASVATPEVPPEPEEAKVVVVRRVAEDAPVEQDAPEPPPPEPVGVGKMSISAVGAGTDFEVYVDGKLVKKGPVVRQEFPSGPHVVSIVRTADGLRKTFEVDLGVDQELKRYWDFDRGEFRR